MKAVKQVQGLDDKTNQLQRNVVDAFQPLVKNPLLDGRVLEKVALVSGTNVIAHGLGRPLQGWTVIRKRASGNFYDTQDSNSTPHLNLMVVSDASVTVDIYVF